MAQEKVRVVIEISGGSLQAVYAGDFVEVVLVDWDNISASFDGDGNPTEGAVIWHPEPEPQMDEQTQALVEAARQKEREDAEDVGAGMCAGCQRWVEECVCENTP